MAEQTQIIYAKSVSDIFYQLKSVSGLEILGGCTGIKKMPPISMSIFNIKELATATKYERRFDFGPGITLSEILKIGPSKLPSVFYEAVQSIGNTNIRNMATLAGNICMKGHRGTLFAPLLALDAKIEIKSETDTKYIPVSKIDSIPSGWIITKIQIPLDEWEVAVFRRLGPERTINEKSAGFVFLADTQRDQVANLKIAFAGPFIFRSQELENKLLGAYLPLSRENITELLQDAEKKFDEARGGLEIPSILKVQFLNLLKFSLEQLT